LVIVSFRVTVSTIGFDWTFEIQTCLFVCMVVDSGSYNFTIKEFWLPTQVVITLLSPFPKCNKWVKNFDVSSANILSSNWEVNASAILLIATDLGIVKLPLSKLIEIFSSLPVNTLYPLTLYGVNIKLIYTLSWSSEICVPSNSNIFLKFKVTVPALVTWI
jgi:hypothetical protein